MNSLKLLLVPALLCVNTNAQSQPVFADDWSATENINVLQFQDSALDPDHGYCCGPNSNCQVQTQFESGTRYYSYSTRKARFDSAVSGINIVFDYKNQRQVQLNGTACAQWSVIKKPRIYSYLTNIIFPSILNMIYFVFFLLLLRADNLFIAFYFYFK